MSSAAFPASDSAGSTPPGIDAPAPMTARPEVGAPLSQCGLSRTRRGRLVSSDIGTMCDDDRAGWVPWYVTTPLLTQPPLGKISSVSRVRYCAGANLSTAPSDDLDTRQFTHTRSPKNTVQWHVASARAGVVDLCRVFRRRYTGGACSPTAREQPINPSHQYFDTGPGTSYMPDSRECG